VRHLFVFTSIRLFALDVRLAVLFQFICCSFFFSWSVLFYILVHEQTKHVYFSHVFFALKMVFFVRMDVFLMYVLKSKFKSEGDAARKEICRFPGYPQNWPTKFEQFDDLSTHQTQFPGSIVVACTLHFKFVVLAQWRNNNLHLACYDSNNQLIDTCKFTDTGFVMTCWGDVPPTFNESPKPIFRWYLEHYNNLSDACQSCFRSLIVGLNCYPKTWPTSLPDTLQLVTQQGQIVIAANALHTVILRTPAGSAELYDYDLSIVFSETQQKDQPRSFLTHLAENPLTDQMLKFGGFDSIDEYYDHHLPHVSDTIRPDMPWEDTSILRADISSEPTNRSRP
jgi:hypothetical protein